MQTHRRRPDTERQRNFKRHNGTDQGDRPDAAHQQDGSALPKRLAQFGFFARFKHRGWRVHLFVRRHAVRDARQRHRLVLPSAGDTSEGEGVGSQSRRRCADGRQCRSTRQRRIRFLRNDYRERRRLLELQFDHGDVHSGPDEEHAVWPGGECLGPRDQLRRRRDGTGAAQRFVPDVGDRPLHRVDHRQSHAAGFDEQHRHVLGVDRLRDGLRQGCRGDERRAERDDAGVAIGQRLIQPARVGFVGPGHADRHHSVAGRHCSVLDVLYHRHQMLSC
ncbi:hypothetical protein EUA02_21670 [Mycobacterium paragordonae]|nr:hypothetical protein EUA02_21670 [Mycobacterium paragordonae]TDL06907.1 hypothetical protein EUA05_15140 [Mycobacterium paragordonae]